MVSFVLDSPGPGRCGNSPTNALAAVKSGAAASGPGASRGALCFRYAGGGGGGNCERCGEHCRAATPAAATISAAAALAAASNSSSSPPIRHLPPPNAPSSNKALKLHHKL